MADREAAPGALAEKVRFAATADAPAVGRMLHEFNTEFDDPSPGPSKMADRVAELIEAGEAEVLIAGGEPLGLAVVRYRADLWSEGSVAYLEELYVAAQRRRQGHGRALIGGVLARARERACARVEVATGTDDSAARGLYEGFGFANFETPDTRMLFYEIEL